MARPVRARTRPRGGGLSIAGHPGGRLLPPDPPARILFVFLDGVGLGSDDPERNPLATADLRNLRALTGRRPTLPGVLEPPTLRAAAHSPDLRVSESPSVVAALRPIDATLGVPGRPQSGTGQTALLTGTNTAVLFGRHFGPWVPTTLRDLLATENLFARVAALGASVAFANSYPQGHMSPGGRGQRRPGAFPLAASTAGVLTRDERALREGRALVSSITTESWRRYVDPSAPTVSAMEAGHTLAAIARGHDLTVFAHFDTDYIGHRGSMEEAIGVIELVDRFLGAVVEALDPDTLLVVTSDHGNLEDITAGHTLNPVPLLTVGRGSEYLSRRVERISDLTPALLELLRGDS